jgi:hypothetical protein
MNYTVLKGDTLGTIAQKFLGSSSRWREIWTANPSIKDPNKLIVGQIIRIPFQSSAQSSAQSSVKSSAQSFPVKITNPTNTNVSSNEKMKETRNVAILLAIAALGIFYFLRKNKENLV